MRCADPSVDVRGPGRPPAVRPAHAAIALGAVLLFTGCGAPDATVAHERSRLVRIKGERPGSARLEGVRPIRGFSVGRDCTFMHCLELVVEALGRDIGYDELMGISGMAFRLQVREIHFNSSLLSQVVSLARPNVYGDNEAILTGLALGYEPPGL